MKNNNNSNNKCLNCSDEWMYLFCKSIIKIIPKYYQHKEYLPSGQYCPQIRIPKKIYLIV